ncbi:hypothetical protein CDAR_459151 [Caerostris darwini]|uniref:Uncharacterized protein n=1 Tax=Caerostris darwini TaxID=1538125 RepID=A0AAV4M5W2_9ARAC|nr:hypothetical protein CDAR_459151 [Caerostris darwini]
MIAPTISEPLRNASPKEFAQALLGSAQNILKLLEEKMQGVSKNPHLPYKRFAASTFKFLARRIAKRALPETQHPTKVLQGRRRSRPRRISALQHLQ